jgi:hypothetical protein
MRATNSRATGSKATPGCNYKVMPDGSIQTEVGGPAYINAKRAPYGVKEWIAEPVSPSGRGAPVSATSATPDTAKAEREEEQRAHLRVQDKAFSRTLRTEDLIDLACDPAMAEAAFELIGRTEPKNLSQAIDLANAKGTEPSAVNSVLEDWAAAHPDLVVTPTVTVTPYQSAIELSGDETSADLDDLRALLDGPFYIDTPFDHSPWEPAT